LQVNGVPVQVPYTTHEWTVSFDGLFVRYVTTFGLTVAFDGKWSICVNVPTALYIGGMCGMCGNNDNNANNDVTMSNGTYVGFLPNASNLLGDSYVIVDPEQANQG
jgi:von Willebrand factor type D domain